jgi:anti-sigma B factor antagonist
MRLRLESRPIGDVLIVQCQGRIIVGQEVNTLHYHIQDSLARYVDIVLQLDQVEFIDSSGLGALVRLSQTARSKGGALCLACVPATIRKTLEITHLRSQFEVHDSVEEAITAAYLGSRYLREKGGDGRPRIVCTYDSTDVCTFLRETLCSAGYNALTTANIKDALVLLKATKARILLISSRMQSVHGQPTRQLLDEIDREASLVVLDEDFATQDPGEAVEKLLSSLGADLPKNAGTAGS